ncbi:DMT family transporter [Desulfosarcina sp.]|uniref:DMT family transporter n=1 Tax=Desulfosarcina sp. TaxID=2027861 RepID=UPI0039709550
MSHPNTSRQVKMDAAVAGPLFMLAAALLFTMLNLLVKQIGPAFTIWHIGFYRFFGGVVVLLMVFGRNGNPYRGHNTRLLIIRGLTGSAAFLSIITAIRLLPVSTALVIFYAYPAFSAVFSYLIYGDRISGSEIACIAVVVIGIAVLFEFRLGGNLFGQIMALSGAAFAGLTVTLIKTLREKNGPVIIYLYFCTMGSLVALPQFALAPLLPSTGMDWAMILGIIFVSVTAQLLMNQGFFYCRGWEGGVFMSSEVIFTAIVGITFLGDPASWRFWIGGCLIVGSAVALNRFKANHTRREKRLAAEKAH